MAAEADDGPLDRLPLIGATRRLAKSGEVITDPDFTASFIISASQKR